MLIYSARKRSKSPKINVNNLIKNLWFKDIITFLSFDKLYSILIINGVVFETLKNIQQNNAITNNQQKKNNVKTS